MQDYEEDYYAILGVEETAASDEVRKAYLRLAKKLHPDRFPNDPEQRALAQREFAKVTRAHDVISDPQRRVEYDAVRALAKKRSLIPEGPTGEGQSAAAPANSSATQTRIHAVHPITEEDNINVKWANKHLGRAEELFGRKRYQEAETAMKEAIRLVPNEPKYRNKLAEIYLARNWRTLAMTEVQAALRIDAKDSDAKTLEARIKTVARDAGNKKISKQRKGFLDQLKDILTKKL
jgi:curved DNA-binding protein CbpA